MTVSATRSITAPVANFAAPAAAELRLRGLPADNGTGYTIMPGESVRLSPCVRRITAANPGYMTGPGTNSYLVGRGHEIAVIDPGPMDHVHIRNLLGTGERISRIFVTHTHPDHSPAASVMKEATGATLIGLPPPLGEHQDQTFKPDTAPAHAERFALSGCSLRAVHTPGHASNHVCYLLEEERILFTGDHVMQGSTVVINPPDGDMTAYITSLNKLRGTGIAHFAPGHGYLIGQPDDMIELLVRHRQIRETRTLSVLTRMGAVTLEALTPVVYDDVPEFKHKWAARSLLAHLIKLERDGVAACEGGVWTAR